MLRVRLIPVLLLRNGRMVKPVNFGSDGERDVGWPITTAKIYDSQDADELIFLDISGSGSYKNSLVKTLCEVAKNCFVPLTAGGGIRNINDVQELLRVGADKVSVNSEAIARPNFITEISDKFGSQCVVVSIDAKKVSSGKYEVFTHRGHELTGLDVVIWAKKVEELGAGEILLTSIDREGALKGYDLELIKLVTAAVSIPVIANGGAGTRQDFVDAIKLANASAVAASSVFHFSDSNLTQVKSFIYNSGVSIRPI